MSYLRTGACWGGGRAGGEGVVLLLQLVQARLQALDAPIQLRDAPLRQLPHPGHLQCMPGVMQQELISEAASQPCMQSLRLVPGNLG